MISREDFGKTASGIPVERFTIVNKAGASVSLISYGATIQSICVFGADGEKHDVCLGYDTVAEYEQNSGYLGAVIGRFGNRIREGVFELNGKTYQIYKNEPHTSLHGGKVGFDKRVWNAEVKGEDTVVFSRVSPDGEENYPSNLNVSVAYTFTDNNELVLDYTATSDGDTPLNLTNHCYFNLHGHGEGAVTDIYLKMDADRITPIDENSLPDGSFMPVYGTPFDFTAGKKIGDGINDDHEQIKNGSGFDHNFVFAKSGFGLKATALSDKTGIRLDTYTDRPGVQLYTGNFMSGKKGKSGKTYGYRGAFCLETQNFPNAVNCPTYPSCILHKGETLKTKTVYAFSVNGK